MEPMVNDIDGTGVPAVAHAAAQGGGGRATSGGDSVHKGAQEQQRQCGTPSRDCAQHISQAKAKARNNTTTAPRHTQPSECIVAPARITSITSSCRPRAPAEEAAAICNRDEECEAEMEDSAGEDLYLDARRLDLPLNGASPSPTPTSVSTLTMIMASAESSVQTTPTSVAPTPTHTHTPTAAPAPDASNNGRLPDIVAGATAAAMAATLLPACACVGGKVTIVPMGGHRGTEGGPGAADSALLGGQQRRRISGEPINETYLTIAIQVFIPFLIAGFGMVGAGLALDKIQHWPVFEEVTELVILIPALLGLKGNLEMTLASRLSTQANLGHMDTTKQQINMILGNLTLIQCQAIVVGFLGSMVAIVMGGIKSSSVELDHAYLLCASSLVTVSLASLILGTLTAGVIILSRHCRINPDNVATPIAAALGDITSLSLLSWVATFLYDSIGSNDWLAPLIIAAYLLAIPLWIWIAKRNLHTRDVLYHGWTPVVGAMLISSMGGLILDFMVARFEGIAVFQPVINGVGGNLVAVQASRISTALHKQSAKVESMEPMMGAAGHAGPDGGHHAHHRLMDNKLIYITPVAAFFGPGTHARTTRVLMSMVLPGHIIFIYVIDYMKAGDTQLSPWFVIVYLCSAVLQVATLLYCAHVMIHWMWKRRIDPDNSAIPYLTSLGDLLGISLLAVAFQFLYLIGDHELPQHPEGVR